MNPKANAQSFPQPSAQAMNYLRTRVLTATPEQLQMMLYDGAVRFAEQARVALDKQDYDTSYNLLSRTQKIVAEMTASLKHQAAPELCGKLSALYNFVYRKLVEANVGRDTAALDEALKILHFQRETWSLLMDQLGKQKAATAATRINAPAPSARMEAAISVKG